MAGDWIPMRMDLLDDPAVIGMASSLKMEEYAVAGRLLKVWSWANRHLKDGHAFVPDKWIDDFTDTPGFAAAMLAAGWLQTRSGGALEFVNFDRWNSQGAKIRLGETLRKRAFREKTGEKSRPESVPKMSRTKTSGCPGPEKRREEKSKEENPPNPPAGGMAAPKARAIRRTTEKLEHPLFAEFWKAYPRREARGVAAKAFGRLEPDRLMLDSMLNALEWQRLREQWQDPEKIPHPSTWLNQRRWEDERPQAIAKPPPNRFPTKAEQEMAEFQARMDSVARGKQEIAADDRATNQALFADDAAGYGPG